MRPVVVVGIINLIRPEIAQAVVHIVAATGFHGADMRHELVNGGNGSAIGGSFSHNPRRFPAMDGIEILHHHVGQHHLEHQGEHAVKHELDGHGENSIDAVGGVFPRLMEAGKEERPEAEYHDRVELQICQGDTDGHGKEADGKYRRKEERGQPEVNLAHQVQDAVNLEHLVVDGRDDMRPLRHDVHGVGNGLHCRFPAFPHHQTAKAGEHILSEIGDSVPPVAEEIDQQAIEGQLEEDEGNKFRAFPRIHNIAGSTQGKVDGDQDDDEPFCYAQE